MLKVDLDYKPLITNNLTKIKFQSEGEALSKKRRALEKLDRSSVSDSTLPDHNQVFFQKLQQAGWKDPLLTKGSKLLKDSKWIRELGEGGFSRVSLIETPVFDQKKVAFKILPDYVVKDFLKVSRVTSERIGGEGLALFFKGHPNLVDTLDLLVQKDKG